MRSNFELEALEPRILLDATVPGSAPELDDLSFSQPPVAAILIVEDVRSSESFDSDSGDGIDGAGIFEGVEEFDSAAAVPFHASDAELESRVSTPEPAPTSSTGPDIGSAGDSPIGDILPSIGTENHDPTVSQIVQTLRAGNGPPVEEETSIHSFSAFESTLADDSQNSFVTAQSVIVPEPFTGFSLLTRDLVITKSTNLADFKKGSDYKFEASASITVDPGVTIGAAGGNISFLAPKITIGEGTKLLSKGTGGAKDGEISLKAVNQTTSTPSALLDMFRNWAEGIGEATGLFSGQKASIEIH